MHPSGDTKHKAAGIDTEPAALRLQQPLQTIRQGNVELFFVFLRLEHHIVNS